MIPSWNDYVRAVYLRFKDIEHADPLAELVELKQEGDVQEFLDRFDELLNQVDITEEQSISIFLGNLKPNIEVQFHMLAPRMLIKAYNQAKLAEQSLMLQQGHTQALVRSSRALLPTSSSSWGNQFKGNGNNQRDSTNFTINNKNPRFVNKPQVQGSRRLSVAEIDKKRSKGICYWFDEKFTPNHRCNQRKQLFIVELTEEEGDF